MKKVCLFLLVNVLMCSSGLGRRWRSDLQIASVQRLSQYFLIIGVGSFFGSDC